MNGSVHEEAGLALDDALGFALLLIALHLLSQDVLLNVELTDSG